jgi:hypothetical protein
MTTHHDFPLEDLAEELENLVAEGWTVFQKWTCRGCGERCISDEPNVIHRAMRHANCGTVSKVSVGNYLKLRASTEEAQRIVTEIISGRRSRPS